MDTWSFVFSGCFFEGPLGHGNHSIYNWLPTLGCLASKLGALYPYSSQWNQGTGGQTYMHFEKWTSLKTQRVNLPSKLYKGVDLPINKKSSTNQPTNLLYIYICFHVYHRTTLPAGHNWHTPKALKRFSFTSALAPPPKVKYEEMRSSSSKVQSFQRTAGW